MFMRTWLHPFLKKTVHQEIFSLISRMQMSTKPVWVLEAQAKTRQCLSLVEKHAFVRHVPIEGDCCALPFLHGTVVVAHAFMLLHTLPVEQGVHVLQELQRVAQRSILVDFCLCERNIFFPAVTVGHGLMQLAGEDERRHYATFMQAGGLEGLVRAAGMTIVRRKNVLAGAVRIAII